MQESPQYQVIARKYRPQTFADVLGQDVIVTTLKNALRFKRFAQAYLFCGCRGTGKTTLARIYAKALNCEQLTSEFEPCNKCSSCLEVSQGRSLDVLEIDGASNRGIDDIRQINETIGYATASGKYKVYLLDEVHMLTKEAFNALLKTLEEPPSHVKFFFATTEPHKVLPTIISRCQRFDLSRISSEIIVQKLSSVCRDFARDHEEEALQILAKLADGSMRDAESLLDQVLCYTEGKLTADSITSSLGLVSTSVFFSLDEAVVAQDFSYAYNLAQQIFSSGKDLSYFLECLLDHFRIISALHLKQTIPLSHFLQKKYTTSLSIYSLEQCLYILDYLVHWHQQLSKTPFKRISLEIILLHIIRSKNRISIDSIVSGIKQMQKGLSSNEDTPPSPVKERPLTPISRETLPSPEPKAEQLMIASPEKETIHEEPAPIAEKILSTSPQKEEVANKEEPIQVPIAAAKAAISPKNSNKHETLMRFSAVELEGVLQKNKN